ncbi:hypothetical protein ACE2AJ_04075 [Aquihabitans daechungensis]|uniref:hypothetical protein n=1 Tax=Aquihabitans daechungensis TaxID=1052257 RepID=UPI003BA2534B
MAFEGDLVDDEVGDRAGIGAEVGEVAAHEAGLHGVVAALRVGAAEVCGGGGVAEAAAGVGPVGVPLPLDLPLPDVLDHGAIGGSAAALEAVRPVEVPRHPEVPAGVGALGAIAGAVLVDEPLPISQGRVELPVGEHRRCSRHLGVGVDQAVADPAVGVGAGDPLHLRRPDPPRRMTRCHRGQTPQHRHCLLTAQRLRVRQVRPVAHHHLRGPMPIGPEHPRPVDAVLHIQLQRMHPPADRLERPHPPHRRLATIRHPPIRQQHVETRTDRTDRHRKIRRRTH